MLQHYYHAVFVVLSDYDKEIFVPQLHSSDTVKVIILQGILGNVKYY